MADTDPFAAVAAAEKQNVTDLRAIVETALNAIDEVLGRETTPNVMQPSVKLAQTIRGSIQPLIGMQIVPVQRDMGLIDPNVALDLTTGLPIAPMP